MNAESVVTPLRQESVPSPSAWEIDRIQRRVLEITSKQLGLPRHEMNLETRLGEDIALDSLDAIEYFMALEAEFNVQIGNEVFQQFFPGLPWSLRQLSDVIFTLMHGSAPGQPVRLESPAQPHQTEVKVCTQLGGKLSARAWMEGPLYEPLGLNREGFRQYRRRTDGMRCVLVPEGEAWIGSDEDSALPVQRPGHVVGLSSFLIDAEPVSNRAFARFLESVGQIPQTVLRQWCLSGTGDRRESFFPLRRGWWRGWQPIKGTAVQPAILVTWYGANAYSLWANRSDWRRYRGDGSLPEELRHIQMKAGPPSERWLNSFLPSEAQWEFAARGKEGASAGRLCAARHSRGASYSAATLPAAGVSELLGMSAFGLHHAAGNVWQWCRDWYAADFYNRPDAMRRDAQNGLSTGIRSERGGSWVGSVELTSPSYRRGRPPQASGRCLGFRCVGFAHNLG